MLSTIVERDTEYLKKEGFVEVNVTDFTERTHPISTIRLPLCTSH